MVALMSKMSSLNGVRVVTMSRAAEGSTPGNGKEDKETLKANLTRIYEQIGAPEASPRRRSVVSV